MVRINAQIPQIKLQAHKIILAIAPTHKDAELNITIADSKKIMLDFFIISAYNISGGWCECFHSHLKLTFCAYQELL